MSKNTRYLGLDVHACSHVGVLSLDDFGKDIGVKQASGHSGFRMCADLRDSYAKLETASAKSGSSENKPNSD